MTSTDKQAGSAAVTLSAVDRLHPPAVAPRTLRNVMASVLRARERGYAWLVDSAAPGLSAVAAAVHHPAIGAGLGTVSVAGPGVRVTEARLPEVAPTLLAAARELGLASSGSAFFASREHVLSPR